MKVLGLDVSTKTGWALFEDGKPVKWGTVFPDRTVRDFGKYPINYVECSKYLAARLLQELDKLGVPIHRGQVVVIEETNPSRGNVYSQKLLEYIHFCLVSILEYRGADVKYVRTGVWRKIANSKLLKEEKALNAKIRRLKAKTSQRLIKIDGKVVGKKTSKHVAIRRVGELFGIQMQKKQEDAADALLLAWGFLNGAPVCDGTIYGGKL